MTRSGRRDGPGGVFFPSFDRHRCRPFRSRLPRSTLARRSFEHNPGRRMIAGTFKASDLAVNACIAQSLCGVRIQQQMIDAKAGVARPAIPFVVPERVHRLIRMHRADRIDPALIEKPPKQRSRLRLHKRILGIGLGGIDVGVGRHDIEIPCEHDRRVDGADLGGVRQEPFHPRELVLEFRSGLRVAIRRIERGDKHARPPLPRCSGFAGRQGRQATRCG